MSENRPRAPETKPDVTGNRDLFNEIADSVEQIMPLSRSHGNPAAHRRSALQ